MSDSDRLQYKERKKNRRGKDGSSFALLSFKIIHFREDFFTTDFTDFTDGKPVVYYPCNAWFNCFWLRLAALSSLRSFVAQTEPSCIGPAVIQPLRIDH